MIAALAESPSYADAVLATRPAAYWPDLTSGREMVKGSHATVGSGVTHSPLSPVEGEVNGTADWQSDTNAFVATPYTHTYRADWSLMLWGRLEIFGNSRALVSNDGAGYPWGWLWYSINAIGSAIDGQLATTLSAYQQEPLNIWHQYVLTCVWDGSEATLVGYLDGVESGRKICVPAEVQGVLRIGMLPNNTSSNRRWRGGLAHAAAWERTLDADVIRYLYLAGLNGVL